VRHYAEVIQRQSTSVSEEEHGELDQLMGKFNIEPEVEGEVRFELEAPGKRAAVHRTISPIVSLSKDRGRDDGNEYNMRIGGVTRKFLPSTQRYRPMPGKRSKSRLKGASFEECPPAADDTTTTTNISHGQKSIYTNATGYTDGTGTTAPHANTLISKFSKKFRRNRNKKIDGAGRIFTVPESISMKSSGEMNQRLMVCASSSNEEDIVSPTNLMLVTRKSSRRWIDENAKGDVEIPGTPFMLGFVQNMLECCSALPVEDEQAIDTIMRTRRT